MKIVSLSFLQWDIANKRLERVYPCHERLVVDIILLNDVIASLSNDGLLLWNALEKLSRDVEQKMGCRIVDISKSLLKTTLQDVIHYRQLYITGSYTLQAVIHYRQLYIIGSYTLQAVIHYRQLYITGSSTLQGGRHSKEIHRKKP